MFTTIVYNPPFRNSWIRPCLHSTSASLCSSCSCAADWITNCDKRSGCHWVWPLSSSIQSRKGQSHKIQTSYLGYYTSCILLIKENQSWESILRHKATFKYSKRDVYLCLRKGGSKFYNYHTKKIIVEVYTVVENETENTNLVLQWFLFPSVSVERPQ